MPRWRLSVRWPLLLLLVSIGFTTLGVVEANRAIRSQRTTAEHALRDYAGFAAWSYEQHLREMFNGGTQEVLGAVNHGDGMHSSPRIPTAQELPHFLPFDPKCGCHRARGGGPNPRMYYAFVLGADTLGVARNTHPRPQEGWEVDRPMPVDFPHGKPAEYTAAEKRWINDTLTRRIRGMRSDDSRFPVVIAPYESTPRFLVYTLMPTTWGDTLVYGVEYAREDVARVLSEVMYEKRLIPATFARGHSMRDLVQLRVTDALGDVVFESEPVREWALDDSTRMTSGYGSLLVRAQINPAMAGSLIIGGLPKSRLPFLIGLLVVAAALAVVSLAQMRRESELTRLRSNFVASISHELRTPLAQMRLYLETLKLGRFKTDAERAWSIDNVERETTRLQQLVERVLRFSRMGHADDERCERIDVTREVERIVDEFGPLAASRGASIDPHIEVVPALELRPAALRHLLLNLLDNAVKYGPSGQVVAVRVHREGDEVRIIVTDEGPGIRRADRDRVWRPYDRGTTAGHNAGSGIGLSIVRDVATLHGGRAWIEDGPNGRGARFIIALPTVARVTAPALVEAVVAG